MGSYSYCYKEFLIEYITVNLFGTKYKKIFTEDYLYSLSEEQLEDIAQRINKTQNHNLNCFFAGLAWGYKMEEWKDSNDTLNAANGALSCIYDLFNINDEQINELNLEKKEEVNLEFDT